MNKKLFFFTILYLQISFVFGQNPQGKINICLMIGPDTVHFSLDTVDLNNFRQYNLIQIGSNNLGPPKQCFLEIQGMKNETFSLHKWDGCISLNYGWSGTDIKIKISRKVKNDSMTIFLFNLLDLPFGLDINYSPGIYIVDIKKGKYSFDKTRNGGLDVTPSNWRKNKVKGKRKQNELMKIGI